MEIKYILNLVDNFYIIYLKRKKLKIYKSKEKLFMANKVNKTIMYNF